MTLGLQGRRRRKTRPTVQARRGALRVPGIPRSQEAWQGLEVPQSPSTSLAVRPHLRMTSMQASAASEAWLRSRFWATKPVVDAPAIAT